MSRNLGSTSCAFCSGPVATTELPRPLYPEDAGYYFEEYRGLIVAYAVCVDCEAPYLAWIDGSHRDCGCRSPPRTDETGRLIPFDLSHRQSFNDEPAEADMPKWRIRRIVTIAREPWKETP